MDKDAEMLAEPLEEDSEAIAALLRQYYSSGGAACPGTVLLPCELEDREALEEWISQAGGRKVRLEVPKRGERLRLVETAALNAQEEILRRTTAEQRRNKTLEWLQKALELDRFPHRIEAFDISNLGDDGIVAAMTVFKDGKPLKKDYRKFRIRDLEMRDDYASMYQAVTRRLQHYLDGDEKFSPLPDLLLIDGGDRHAQTAERAQQALGVSIPTFGMVKDDRHRTRALITAEGREIGISSNQAVFSLIGTIQEETHRSAVTYQRKLRGENLHSVLETISGIGEKRRDLLLQRYRSVRAIREASEEELAELLPKNVAHAVYMAFRSAQQEKAEEETTPCG